MRLTEPTTVTGSPVGVASWPSAQKGPSPAAWSRDAAGQTITGGQVVDHGPDGQPFVRVDRPPLSVREPLDKAHHLPGRALEALGQGVGSATHA